eukprot:3504660-Rhodomonas_salina.1
MRVKSGRGTGYGVPGWVGGGAVRRTQRGCTCARGSSGWVPDSPRPPERAALLCAKVRVGAYSAVPPPFVPAL